MVNGRLAAPTRGLGRIGETAGIRGGGEAREGR